MSAYDSLSRWFESEEVKVPFDCWAAIGFFRGVHTPCTVHSIMFHLCGENGLGFSKGGNGAFATSGRNHGMEIITGAAVDKIVTNTAWRRLA